jgi:hypothetical protein
LPETEVSLLALAVAQVFGDDAARIEERMLRLDESNPVLGAVPSVLVGIPLEARSRHDMVFLPYFSMAGDSVLAALIARHELA